MLQTGRIAIATRGNDAVDPQSGTESGTAPADATTTAALLGIARNRGVPHVHSLPMIHEFWSVVRTPQTPPMPAVIGAS